MAVLDRITLGDIHILTSDSDPTTGGGVVAPIGSFILMSNGSATYRKNSVTATDWVLTIDVNNIGISGGVTTNQSNTYGDFDQIFRSSRLLLRNPANTFSYIFAGSAIVADRTITFPLLTSNDTIVTEAFIQALTNKTINGSLNTITNISLTSAVTSTLPVTNGGTGVTGFGGTNTLLYTSTANTLSSIATSNTSALITNSSGVPSWTSGTTANRILRTDGTSITFSQVTLTTDVTGTLPIANGGTNGTTATTGFNNLSPLTTKGDIIVRDSTNNIRQAVGTNGQILVADSTTTSGIKWMTTNFYVSDTVTTTTTSTTDTAMTNMTLTPGAGDYLVIFNGTISVNSAANNQTTTTIYVNGIAVADSVRSHFTTTTDQPESVTNVTKVTGVLGGQAIDVRWRVSASTVSAHQRSLTLIKLI